MRNAESSQAGERMNPQSAIRNPQSTMVSYPRIFIAAGEHSGDRFGASLAEALRRLSPDVRLTGVGGPRMAAAGVRVVADTVGHSGMGLLSTFGNAQRWVRVFRNCIREFNREPPDILVPVDNPGFNLGWPPTRAREKSPSATTSARRSGRGCRTGSTASRASSRA